MADATDLIGRWRVIMTDSENLTGVAPVCPFQRAPGGEHDLEGPEEDDETARFDETGVYDCCPLPHLEVHSRDSAQDLAELMSSMEVVACE